MSRASCSVSLSAIFPPSVLVEFFNREPDVVVALFFVLFRFEVLLYLFLGVSFRFQESLEMIRPSVSLGGVDTIICSPALTSHRHLSAEEKTREGITDGLLRLSLGIEDADDLIKDMEQALAKS